MGAIKNTNSTDDDDVKSEMFLKLKFKVKDKNAKDLFMVSKYLQGSVRGALMGAIKKSLGVLDPKVVKGIDSSLQESYSLSYFSLILLHLSTRERRRMAANEP